MSVSRDVFVFSLDKGIYGIDLDKVKVLRGIQCLTRIAGAPDCLIGVLSLQGSTVPVMDLRIKYGIATPRYDPLTVVVVLETAGRLVGIVTDGIADIKKISAGQIEPASEPDFIFNTASITGVARLYEYKLVLLDIDCSISAEEIPVIEEGVDA